MLNDIVFGTAKNLLSLLPGVQSANGITAQVAANGLVTLDGTATADTAITIPANTAALGTGQYTASMAVKSGYATGAVTAAFQQAVQAAQIITNGNFAADGNGDGLADNFALWSSSPVSCVGNTQTFIARAQYGQLVSGALPMAGHRYYVHVQLKAQPGKGVYLQANNGSGSYPSTSASGAGEYQALYMIADIASGYTSGFFAVGDPEPSNWTAISVQSFMAIDMGADASNPLYSLTAAQMATLFPSYFGGTQTVSVSRATVSIGNPSTFAEHGTPISSVQLAVPSGTSCQQYQIGLQVESGSTATGWVSPGTQGVIFYPATGETGTITNTGNVDAYPVITVTGACANPSISNETTGESITANVALGSADTLIIDCRPATRGCYLNGALAFGIKQGLGWMHCPPGDNTMTFNRQGYDTKRHCTISLQGRYL